jgi:transcriptional regulator with XRE-family HTH domain
MTTEAGLDGARLQATRELKGVSTQAALGARVGVPQPHISDLENGKLRNQSVFLKVADELECTTDFLFRRGPFKDADEPIALREAVSRMALDVFCDRINVPQVHKDRCEKIVGRHAGAPITADGWLELAEMIALAVDAPSPVVGRISASKT